MKKRKDEGVALVCLDTKSGMLKRYVRAKNPRHPGDTSMISETHKGIVDLALVGKDSAAVHRFRSNPEQFFPEEADAAA